MKNAHKLETIKGTTVQFAGNGRKLGYPTANLAVQTDLKDGVYFGMAKLGSYKNQPAMIFIGTPTTVGDKGRRVEAHLLDIADKDYYGQKLKLDILYFHRPNQTFGSVDELLAVMKDDEVTAREWFKHHTLRIS
jgi:riboflavin kinase/FMN adenylyltransferase